MAFRVFRTASGLPADFGPSAVTIGNFDGVHAGHRQLMRRVVQLGREHHWRPSVLTFDPHPTTLVAPARAPHLLTSMEQRVRLMQATGIEQVLVLPFTWEVARWTPEEFVRHLLGEQMRARAVVVGDNFRFGSKQSGTRDTLQELGDRFGMRVEIEPDVVRRGRLVSSSEIRKLLAAGEVARANRLLESPYALEGEVVAGHGVGAKQTVPTLNLAPPAQLVPAIGVYVTRTFDQDRNRWWPSISNIGYRPTFGGDRLTIETYLLGPLDGEAPRAIRVEFLRWVREERKFDSPAELKAQILRDVGRAQSFHRRWDAWAGAAVR
jgi:riboflavin kinase/FMN adenylyltransferase